MPIDLYHVKHFWRKPWLVDALLSLAIFASMFFTYVTRNPNTGLDYNAFLLNLSTELLGVWLSVRIIERMIRKQERLYEIRRNLLKNLRHPYDVAQGKYPNYNRQIVKYLSREMKWFELRWDQRQNVFLFQEQELSRKIISINYELIRSIENVVIASELESSDANYLKSLIEERVQHVDSVLSLLETEIEKLVLTFWETDNPDSI